MTQTELEDIIEKILLNGDPAYNSPTGAFLEYLTDLAAKLNLDTFADACAYYTTVYPECSPFIAARVPGILCNRYFSVLPGFNYEEFIRWSLSTPDWARSIKDGFVSSYHLKSAVAVIRSVVEDNSSRQGTT